MDGSWRCKHNRKHKSPKKKREEHQEKGEICPWDMRSRKETRKLLSRKLLPFAARR
jgi:hypothetical protein